MVRMCVRYQDPADGTGCQIANGINVNVDLRTGIYDRDFLFTHEVGVGSRAGHHSRVRRDKAAHALRQRYGDSRSQFLSHVLSASS